MKRCEALKGDGTRCQGKAMEGFQWCYSHRPDLAEERRRNARRGGKTGGRGRTHTDEATDAKRIIRGLIAKLLRDEVEPLVANSIFTGLNVMARYVEVGLKIREQEELVERMEALEEALQSRSDRGGYGA
jgi:hypothetical protein